MNSTNDNPTITLFLRYFTLVETLVLIGAGFGLFLFPEISRAIWPWELAPFNNTLSGRSLSGGVGAGSLDVPFRALVANPPGAAGNLHLHIHCACRLPAAP